MGNLSQYSRCVRARTNAIREDVGLAVFMFVIVPAPLSLADTKVDLGVNCVLQKENLFALRRGGRLD